MWPLSRTLGACKSYRRVLIPLFTPRGHEHGVSFTPAEWIHVSTTCIHSLCCLSTGKMQPYEASVWSTLGIISTDTTISGHRLVVDKAHRVAEGVGFHPRVYDPRILGYAPSAPCWSSESTSYASLTLTTLLATLPALSNGQQHTHGDRRGAKYGHRQPSARL